MENCYKKANEKRGIPDFKLNEKKDIFTKIKKKRQQVGFYHRFYWKKDYKTIRFELEIQFDAMKRNQTYFFLDQFEKFEQRIVYQFYKQVLSVIGLKSVYSDSIVDPSRRVYNLSRTKNCFVTTYLHSQTTPISDSEFFFLLFNC